MRQLIETSGISDRIIFVGEMPDPHPYFAASDIMTFASSLEGFGTVVPEAQANGLAVVVRRLPGVNELFVCDGETGLFFDDDAGYLRSVLRLADDPALRRRIGSRARDFVHATFDMTQVARRYLAIYGFADLPAEPPEAPAARVAALGTTASILLPRLHRPAATERVDRPYLLTIIDAEEEFNWDAPFSRARTGVEFDAAPGSGATHPRSLRCDTDLHGGLPGRDPGRRAGTAFGDVAERTL